VDFFMLTRRGKYGLKAMLTLTREHGHGPMLIGDLAEADAIPKKFLENILLALKHRGLARAEGPRRYQLARCRSHQCRRRDSRLDGPLALVSRCQPDACGLRGMRHEPTAPSAACSAARDEPHASRRRDALGRGHAPQPTSAARATSNSVAR
jgi:hypothetical protein